MSNRCLRMYVRWGKMLVGSSYHHVSQELDTVFVPGRHFSDSAAKAKGNIASPFYHQRYVPKDRGLRTRFSQVFGCVSQYGQELGQQLLPWTNRTRAILVKAEARRRCFLNEAHLRYF